MSERIGAPTSPLRAGEVRRPARRLSRAAAGDRPRGMHGSGSRPGTVPGTGRARLRHAHGGSTPPLPRSGGTRRGGVPVDGAPVVLTAVNSRGEADLIVGLLRSAGLRAAAVTD